jgi:peptidoglycan/xylan/chitin deacetylase (PgdA/CDA1 family)
MRPPSRASFSGWSKANLAAMREQVKQVLKNSVYRAIGEVANGARAVNGDGRALRVLMYHKVNDLPNNRMSMPVPLFDEQMSHLGELGYTVVDLDAVLAHYREGKPLPAGAVLITFDDGYRDNLVNAAPILRKHGYPAVQFVPIAFVGDSQPLPHERYLSSHGVHNPTVDWNEVLELERYGVRIESHGISHKPLAELEIDEAAREIAISKLKLEEALGRPVRAFSYVKGSEADYKPVHPSLVRQAGYDLAFTAVSGANSPDSDPLQLRRYNVEPYSRRTFELVLAGACDLISMKDTVTGTHARRVFNAVLGTTSR